MTRKKFRIIKEVEIRAGKSPVTIRYFIEYKWWIFWRRYRHWVAQVEGGYRRDWPSSYATIKKVSYWYDSEDEARNAIIELNSLYSDSFKGNKIREAVYYNRYGYKGTLFLNLSRRFYSRVICYECAYTLCELHAKIDRREKSTATKKIIEY